MRLSAFPACLLALLASSVNAQQYLISDLSFGHAGRLTTPESPGKIPYYNLGGSIVKPQVLSNKVILTPVSPGNQRGSIWSSNPLQVAEWITDVDFRANGPERGGGNLNVWLVEEGERNVGSSSIYTVGKFTGLALVVDSHGGTGGMMRAFLNDGTVDYSQLGNVDKLAWGHCQFSYRNLGRPSQIKIRQSINIFKVEIDGKLCFESNLVSMPTGYNIGVTAATPDTPDSFEVFKIVVMADNTQTPPVINNNEGNSRFQQPPKRDVPQSEPIYTNDFESPRDEDADVFQTSKAQFQDLHNRLQSTNHQLSSIYRSVSRHHQLDEQRHTEMKNLVADLKEQLSKLDQVETLTQRVRALENDIRGMRNELGKKIQANERSVKGYLSDHHDTLSQRMADSVPGHGKLIFIIVGMQVVLVAAYLVYKRRKHNSPKKYL